MAMQALSHAPTANMAKPKTLLSFPIELLEAVAENADKEDLLAFRLTSKTVAAAADRVFLQEYCTHRNHLVTTDSLEHLVHITSTPRMCEKIKTLTFSMAWMAQPKLEAQGHSLAPYGEICTPELLEAKREEEWRLDAICAAWQLEAHDFTSASRRKDLLYQVLRNIVASDGKKCLDLRLVALDRGNTKVHGSSSLKGRLGLSPPDLAPRGEMNEFFLLPVDYVTTHLLEAVGNTGILLGELHLPGSSSAWQLNRYNDIIPPSLAHVQALGLHTHTSHDFLAFPNWRLHMLQRGQISFLPALTSLCFSARIPGLWLRGVFPPGQLQKIEVYQDILGDNFNARQLLSFLQEHQTSLVHFRVSGWKWPWNEHFRRTSIYDAMSPMQSVIVWVIEKEVFVALEKLELCGHWRGVRFEFDCIGGEFKEGYAGLTEFFEANDEEGHGEYYSMVGRCGDDNGSANNDENDMHDDDEDVESGGKEDYAALFDFLVAILPH